MQTRSRAAATTALLLTASVTGLAAVSGTAQATTHAHTAARATNKLTVTITSTAHGPKLSLDTFSPGKTMFKVVRKNVGGTMEIVRFKHGYTIADFAADAPGLFADTPDLAAINRIDTNVEFYGGMPVAKKTDPTAVFKFGLDIDKAGTYYVINVDKESFTTFQAKGAHQTRPLPSADGKLGMKGSMTFNAPASDPHRGWMKTTNNATQPHFVNLSQVKKATTDAEVQAWLAAPSGPPTFFKPGGGETDTEVVGPGHTVVWKYHVPKGKYLSLCFYPDKDTGVPHAFMGMYALLDMK